MYEVKDMKLVSKGPQAIETDAQQDLMNASAMYENGWLTMEFTRKQDTGDSQQVGMGLEGGMMG